MNTNAVVLNAKAFIYIAALTACAAISAPAQAGDHKVIVKIPVSYAGLDLNQPAGAQALYHRLQYAAYVACTEGDRVGLEPEFALATCIEKSMGDAVRSAKQPQLTMIYLKAHTPKEAMARGIEVPVLVAEK